jgi:hypothetical protein
MNTQGRLSLDLLIGLSIFLFTFVFIAQFLPGVFADVRSEIALSHEAYKVTVMLAETQGAWSNGTMNGTNWEDYPNLWGDPTFYFLPGLSTGRPDFLEYDKIIALQNATRNYYDKVREMLGLKTPDREYNFHVSLESLDSRPYNRTLVTTINGKVVLDAGAPIPSSGYISRYERIVWIDDVSHFIGWGYVDTTKGGIPTPRCFINGTQIDCYFEYNYPVNTFLVQVIAIYPGAPKISVCADVGTCPPGACPLRSPGDVCVYPDNSPLGVCQPLVVGTLYDLTTPINLKLSDQGATNGDNVCVRVSLRAVNASIYFGDTTIHYLAGKPTAKLVVYVW